MCDCRCAAQLVAQMGESMHFCWQLARFRCVLLLQDLRLCYADASGNPATGAWL
jgi:hypothetical protein